MKLMPILIEWSISSALLILSVTALRSSLGKRVSAGLRYSLWAVVLIRLLVPVQLFSYPVPASVLPEPNRGQIIETASPNLVSAAPGVTVGMPAIAEPVPNGGVVDYEFDATLVPPPKAEPVNVFQVLGWLWLSGSVVMAVALLVSNIKFARRLRRVRAPLDGVECPLPVYIARGLPSPCLFGLIPPAVYVTPETADDPVILRHVLAHEYTHFRHGDHIWNILRNAALAVHWWNPLVWLAVVLSRRDCELACDEGALKRLGDGERVAYGRTLLVLLTVKPRPGDLLTCATTMTSGQKSVFDRVTRIAHAPKRWLWAAVVAVLAAALACVCAFGSTRSEPDADPAAPSPEPFVPASASPGPEATATPDPTPPAVAFHPTVFGGGLDFEFYDTGKRCPLRFSNLTWAIASTQEFAFQVERYVILDLDGDGDTELILEMEGQGGFYIFRGMDKWLYGFWEVPRGLMNLKADGTFEGSSGAADWGYYTVSSFDSDRMESTPFTWCESSENYEELYFVDGLPATRREFEAAVAVQNAKEDALWRPWTGELGYPEEAKEWLDWHVTAWLEPVEVPLVSAADGPDGNWALTYHGRQARFFGGGNWYGEGDLPRAYLLNLNGDGREEIAFTLQDASVSGEVTADHLYLFDAETLEQYDTSGVADMVYGYLSSTSDDTYFYVSIPEFDLDVTIPRDNFGDPEHKLRDTLEFYPYPYFGIYLDSNRITCCFPTGSSWFNGQLGLEGKEVVCTGFEYLENRRENFDYADMLLWGMPLFFFDEDGHTGFVDAADIPLLFNKDDPYTAIQSFAIVDLDQDGVDEVVLHVCGVAGDMGGYLVLYKQWGGVSGFKSYWRTFWDLKTDGTLSWSSPTGQDNGWGSYPNLYTAELWELSRMHSSWGEPDAKFVVEGIPATEAEYRAYDEQQRAKPDAVWYEYTRENIEALLQF